MITLNCVCLETAMVFGGTSRPFEVAGTDGLANNNFVNFITLKLLFSLIFFILIE